MEQQISGHTVLTCLLGHPVAHSISPKMHNLSFARNGLDYAYLAFDVTPERLADAVCGLRAVGCRGWNLTMPLKTAILPLLDELSPAARLSGSVNTVVNDGGQLIGHTTDGIGYMDSLADAGFDIRGEQMTLLGAGGAATSICTQAAIDGVRRIHIFKRKNGTFPQTQAFARRVEDATGCQIEVTDIADFPAMEQSIRNSRILVNATSVGMGDDRTSLVPARFLHKDLIVSDIIYHPAVTQLLADAMEKGCATCNGMYMLLFQGAAAFMLWTGRQMPIDYIKEQCFSQED